MSRFNAAVRHGTLAILEGSLIAALVVGLIAGTALAGKGGNGGNGGGGKPPKGGGTGTISGPVIVRSDDAVVSHGDFIRFTVSTTATTEPWVRLECYQNGALVGAGLEGYFERSLDDGVFGLYSSEWVGGAAECVAKLRKPDGTVLATTTFPVAA